MEKEFPISRSLYWVNLVFGVFTAVILFFVYNGVEPNKLTVDNIDSWILILAVAFFFLYALISCFAMSSTITDGSIGWYRPYKDENGRTIIKWGKIIAYTLPMTFIECWGVILRYWLDTYLTVMFDMPKWLIITILTFGFLVLIWHLYFYVRIAYEVAFRKPRTEV